MHPGSLTVSRFWSCNNVTISLRPDLTILVGENNGGKSNVIDASGPRCGRLYWRMSPRGQGPSARRVLCVMPCAWAGKISSIGGTHGTATEGT
jgi:hypothetical protein